VIRRPLAPRWRMLLGATSLGLILVGYTFLSWTNDNPTLPTWLELWAGVKRLATPNRRDEIALFIDAAATAKRFFLAMGISTVGGVLLGIFMGTYEAVEAAVLPVLTVFAKVVPTAAIAIFFVVFGVELEMFVGMVVFGVLPSMAISIYLAARDVPDELIHKAYTLGASHLEVIWEVVFPTILPKVIDAIRLQIGPALVFLVAAEVAVASEGFGYTIRVVMKRTDMTIIYPYLAILALFGFSMDYGLRGLRTLLCPWYEEGRS
jgi:NitT/TauT family transport system permease protein